MSDGAPRGKLSGFKSEQERIQQFAARRTQASAQQSTQTEDSAAQFADIESNTFYKILLNPEIEPAQKKEEVAKALTFVDDRQQAKAKLEEFIKFKEYLQFQRKRMAQEIISLTDTEAFSELQAVYQEINQALIEFEDKITPLTEIVDAVYTLRLNGLTFDAFREILKDKEEEKRLAEERGKKEADLRRVHNELRELRVKNADLGSDRSFFGLGPIRMEAKAEIARNEMIIAEKEIELNDITKSIEDLSKQIKHDSQLGEFVVQKTKLRELLDISSEEHRKRQEALVSSAQDFINKTESKVSSVLQHFSGMNSQIDRLSEANYTMREVYAILNDAAKDASESNQARREDLQRQTGGESDIQKMQRERTLRDVENHITAIGQSHVDTTAVFAELTGSGHRIKSMKDGNEQQIAKTRALHTSGVAGVADQLSTVLQAVSAAALGESSEMAKLSLERMNKTTQDLSQKEVIRVALGTKEVNADLGKALADLEEYGEVIKTATNLTRTGLQETKRLLGELEETARNVQEDVRESIGVAADVAAGKGGAHGAEGEKPQKQPSTPNPFNF